MKKKEKFTKSFYDWCIENNHEDWLLLWDYELNDCSPKEVGCGSPKKYYFKCPRGIHKSELKRISDLTREDLIKILLKCNQCNSFGQWCLDKDKKNWLDLWDYELNNCNPFEVARNSRKKCYFKCPRGIHKSELKQICSITHNKNYKFKCYQCESFGQFLIDELGENALELYWDYELNNCNPFEIAKCCHQKVWIKCQEVNYHNSYEVSCINFYNGARCSYCGNFKVHPKDSFGQMLIDEYGTLDGIWDFEKNGDLDPFGLAKQSSKKVWLFCQEKDYHGSYEVVCSSFYNGNRCPYCSHKSNKVHPKDSFAQYHINNTDKNFIEKYWSNKNTVDPFTIAIYSNKIKVWIKCQNDEEHEDYLICCANFTKGHRCPECNESKGERAIKEWLNSNGINFIAQKTFPNLLGIRNGSLLYDFYLPEYNLLIEYQGIQHYEPQDFKGEGKEKAKSRFKTQQEHDNRKRKYAKENMIELLEIPYWDFNDIKAILNKNIK